MSGFSNPESPNCIVVIPARMAASRFPGKPLVEVGEHPLIWHAWHAAVTWPGAASVVVASPDEAILDAARAFGAVTQHSDPELRCGSQRGFEVFLRNPKYWSLINLQCDEPGITHAMLDALERAVQPHHASIATLAAPFPTGVPSPDPNEVKVVANRFGRTFYFTRHPIAGSRRHVGAYGFAAKAIHLLAQTPESDSGQAERLEQLDWLDAGWDIQVVAIDEAPITVNTPRDLERFRAWLEREKVA